MSDLRALLLSALYVLLPWSASGAQQAAAFRGRLVRAEALQDSLKTVDSRARDEALRRATVGHAGPVALMLRSGDPSELAAAEVWRPYGSLGVFPESAIARFILVEDGVAQNGDRIDGRTVVQFGRPGGLHAGADPRAFAVAIADNAIWNLSRALLTDSLTGQWLGGLDPRLVMEPATLAVAYELAAGRWTATRGCLSGQVDECLVYLGLEEQPVPRRRYPISDIRADLQRRNRNLGTSARRCVSGDDAACLDAFRTNEPPSGSAARYSVIAFLRHRYGPDTVRRLLNDSAGTLGRRIARVTGERTESVVGQWREWVLATTKSTPVRAGFPEVTVSVLVAGVLLLMATRSGRWRE